MAEPEPEPNNTQKYLKWGLLGLLALLIIGALVLFVPKLFGGNNEDGPLTFTTYSKDAGGLSQAGGAAGLEISIDIPEGKGELQDRVAEGIRDIIRQSTFAEEIQMPVEGSLQEIVDGAVDAFNKGLESGDLDALNYILNIHHGYQGAEAISFRVEDGVFGNGGAHEINKVIRLSDGHIMAPEELTTITFKDVKALVKQYASDEQKEMLNMMEEEGYSMAPDTLGCLLTYLVGSHFYTDVIIPLDAIAPFLTEEGKRLFGVAVDDANATGTEAATVMEEAPPAEPGRGDLGVFDLRGPVKECKWGKRTLSFNEQGQWTAENGKSLKKIYPGGVKRDKNGRITKGMLDAYDETGHDYQLNSKGLVTEINYRDFMDGGTIVTYTYDADGYVATETIQECGMDAYDEETGEELKPIVSKYTILEKDQVGNWIKRKDQDGQVVTRTITYY